MSDASNIRLLRALANGFARTAEDCGDERNGLLLARMAQGFGLAVDCLLAVQPLEPEPKPDWMNRQGKPRQ
jgi:hypothetical protein